MDRFERDVPLGLRECSSYYFCDFRNTESFVSDSDLTDVETLGLTVVRVGRIILGVE